jgi:hypothetical protein
MLVWPLHPRWVFKLSTRAVVAEKITRGSLVEAILETEGHAWLRIATSYALRRELVWVRSKLISTGPIENCPTLARSVKFRR